MTKKPFDVDEAMRLVDKAVEPFPKAALFELAEEGHRSAFEQLVACILSVRTRDETTLPVARALFADAPTAAALAEMSVEEIDERISACTFHRQKAENLRRIASEVEEEHGGKLPCDEETILSFRGVGPKCANLVLGIACGAAKISVDVHVHRVTNRWGYVDASSPEETMRALEDKLPDRYAVEINRLLVPFGKHVCTGRRPKCSTCPVEPMCAQVGVEAHR